MVTSGKLEADEGKVTNPNKSHNKLGLKNGHEIRKEKKFGFVEDVEKQREPNGWVVVPKSSLSQSAVTSGDSVKEYETVGGTKGKRKGNESGSGDDEEREREPGAMCRFPMATVKRIMKDEDSDLQCGRDVVFLVNKAADSFLQQLCKEAYDRMVGNSKKSLAYNHLAHVVNDEHRYEFLRDFVPLKVTAETALAERKLAESSSR